MLSWPGPWRGRPAWRCTTWTRGSRTGRTPGSGSCPPGWLERCHHNLKIKLPCDQRLLSQIKINKYSPLLRITELSRRVWHQLTKKTWGKMFHSLRANWTSLVLFGAKLQFPLKKCLMGKKNLTSFRPFEQLGWDGSSIVHTRVLISDISFHTPILHQ
jgi:hypothetical protein